MPHEERAARLQHMYANCPQSKPALLDRCRYTDALTRQELHKMERRYDHVKLMKELLNVAEHTTEYAAPAEAPTVGKLMAACFHGSRNTLHVEGGKKVYL